MTKSLIDLQNEVSILADEVYEVFGEDIDAVLRKFKKMKNDFNLIQEASKDDLPVEALSLADIIRHRLYIAEQEKKKEEE